jgi:hypothetical protein
LSPNIYVLYLLHFIYWFIGWSHTYTKESLFFNLHTHIILIEGNNVHVEVRRETMQNNGPCLPLIICLNSLENHPLINIGWDTEFTLDVRHSKIIFLSGSTLITNTHLFLLLFFFLFFFFGANQPTMQINKSNGSTQSKTLRFLRVENLLMHVKGKITGMNWTFTILVICFDSFGLNVEIRIFRSMMWFILERSIH